MASPDLIYTLSDEQYEHLNNIRNELELLLSAICDYRGEDQHVTLHQSGLTCFLLRLTTDIRMVLEECRVEQPPISAS